MSKQTSTENWCEENIDEVAEGYYKSFGKDLGANIVDIKAVLYSKISKSLGYECDVLQYEPVYNQLEVKMHKAIEDVEERLVTDAFYLEQGFYSRTDKFENALKKKGLFNEIMEKNAFYESFIDELVDSATPLIGGFVKGNDKVTYTNIFKYRDEFADYIAECLLDGRLELTKPEK